jgi:hypothetical protein
VPAPPIVARRPGRGGGHHRQARRCPAALIAIRPGCGPRLIDRAHHARQERQAQGVHRDGLRPFLDAATSSSAALSSWSGTIPNTHLSGMMRAFATGHPTG